MSHDPSWLTNLKRLSRQKPDLASVLVMLSYLKRTDDRVVAIVGATQVEDALEDAIVCKMVPLNKTEYGELFVGDQPLGSLSSKIKLAYALGIIGRQARLELTAIRLIRNVFAHSRKAIWFSTDAVAEACDHLTIPERTPSLPTFRGIDQPINTPRKRFSAATALYASALMRFRWPELLGPDTEAIPLD